MLKACDPDSDLDPDAEGTRIYLLSLIFHKQDAYAAEIISKKVKVKS